MLNGLRAYSRVLAGFILPFAEARSKPSTNLTERQAAIVARAFPEPLQALSHPNATFIHEIGNDSPLACLTGEDHEDKGAALVTAVYCAQRINSNSRNVDLL